LISTVITGVIAIVIILATYWLFGTAKIPYTALYNGEPSLDRDSAKEGGGNCYAVSDFFSYPKILNSA
jgi:hypothetical protein